jgi:hypothetical protein
VIQFLEATARNRIDPVSFAPTIIRAAEDGDDVAGSLLARAGQTLGATAAHAVRQLRLQDEAFELVLAGSMFDTTSTMLVDALETCVRAVAPELRLHRLEVPPVVGAALLAIELAGETPGTVARAALADDVASALGRAALRQILLPLYPVVVKPWPDIPLPSHVLRRLDALTGIRTLPAFRDRRIRSGFAQRDRLTRSDEVSAGPPQAKAVWELPLSARGY